MVVFIVAHKNVESSHKFEEDPAVHTLIYFTILEKQKRKKKNFYRESSYEPSVGPLKKFGKIWSARGIYKSLNTMLVKLFKKNGLQWQSTFLVNCCGKHFPRHHLCKQAQGVKIRHGSPFHTYALGPIVLYFCSLSVASI